MSSARASVVRRRHWALAAGAVLASAAAARTVAVVGPSTVVPVECPFRALTGWLCPLCGSTRAVGALGHGDLAAAFTFNPLFVVAVGLLLVVGLVFGILAVTGRTDVVVRRLPSARTSWIAVVGVLLVFAVGRNLA